MKNIVSHISLPKFNLLTPSSLNEALTLLDQYQESAKLLAGGTDLLIELRQRLQQPKVLIDIKRIPELQTIAITEEELIIGATTPISKIISFPEVKEDYRALYQSLIDLADEILRQRATIGGNIGTASPAADASTPLLIFEAKITALSKSRGKRIIPIKEFFTGVKQNCLSPDEMITSISIPRPIDGSRSSFKKMKRSVEDLALVGVACLRNINQTYLAYSAVAPTPIFIDISNIISSNITKLDESVFTKVWNSILPLLKPIDDVRASKEYRIHVSEILTRTILKEVF